MKSESIVKIEAGKKYFFCTCEKSANYPFCDGSHKGSGLKSLCYESPIEQTVQLADGCVKEVQE